MAIIEIFNLSSLVFDGEMKLLVEAFLQLSRIGISQRSFKGSCSICIPIYTLLTTMDSAGKALKCLANFLPFLTVCVRWQLRYVKSNSMSLL